MYFGNNVIDIALWILSALAIVSFGVTIAAALAVASLGYTMVYAPYVRKQIEEHKKNHRKTRPDKRHL